MVGDFRKRGDALYATRHELFELGLKPGDGDMQAWLPLSALPSLTYRLDPAAQTVAIDADAKTLKPNQLMPERAAEPALATESGVGAVLNYDLVATHAAGRWTGDGLFDARAYSPWGVLSTSMLGRTGAINAAIRLDSAYVYSDPESLRRLRVGDLISSGQSWTRPLRLGGVQFAHDFALRPDLVTFPIPSIAGEVAVPSTVDVLVNGVQQLSATAAPGPFELRQLPVVSGANNVSLVINNALGQPVTQTLPIYASTALLAAGLDAYSIEAGAVRLGYGVRSDDYRDPAGSASYRRGLNDWLTVSAHAEGAQGLGMAGAGVNASVGGYGVASLAVAGSAGQGGRGLLGYAAFERITPRISLAASAQFTDGNFHDLASLYGDTVPRSQVRASLGIPLGDAGSIGVAYTRQRRASVIAPLRQAVFVAGELLIAPTFAPPAKLSLLSASYSRPVFAGRALFYATAFRDFDQRHNTGAIFGLTMPLGQRNSVSAGASITSGQFEADLQATRSVIEVGDAGGQAAIGQGGRNSRQYALGEYKSPWALVSLGADRTDGTTALRASASGALVFAGGGMFAANTIRDSFAIVDTGGAPGVQVLSENRPVEKTGASGRVLVPDLRSFEVNRIGIEPADVPLDVDVGDTTRLVRPMDRSGVFVRFPIRPSQAALVRLVDPSGAPLPIGARVRIDPAGEENAVGYDGEAYIRGLQPHAQLTATLPGGATCAAAIDYRPEPGTIPTIGPLPCRPARAP